MTNSSVFIIFVAVFIPRNNLRTINKIRSRFLFTLISFMSYSIDSNLNKKLKR